MRGVGVGRGRGGNNINIILMYEILKANKTRRQDTGSDRGQG